MQEGVVFPLIEMLTLVALAEVVEWMEVQDLVTVPLFLPLNLKGGNSHVLTEDSRGLDPLLVPKGEGGPDAHDVSCEPNAP